MCRPFKVTKDTNNEFTIDGKFDLVKVVLISHFNCDIKEWSKLVCDTKLVFKNDSFVLKFPLSYFVEPNQTKPEFNKRYKLYSSLSPETFTISIELDDIDQYKNVDIIYQVWIEGDFYREVIQLN